MASSENVQAGGHPGTLIFEGDKLLKRCKEGEIGFWEWLFNSVQTDNIAQGFKYLCPNYYGTVQREGGTYIMIDNLTYGFRNPCIMDAKLGRITWTKHHKPEKIESQMAKAKTTTTGSLGFRLCGMVVKDSQGQKVEAWTKDDGYFNITAENIHEHFAKLVTKNGRVRVDLVDKLIEQTQRMLDWFFSQRMKHFITTSILYVTGDEDHPHCQAKLIDFAHVIDAEGQLDESKEYTDAIEALGNVIRVWERVKSLA